MAFVERLIVDSGPGRNHLSVVGTPTVAASDYAGFGNKIQFPAGAYGVTSKVFFDPSQHIKWSIEIRVSNVDGTARQSLLALTDGVIPGDILRLEYFESSDRFIFRWKTHLNEFRSLSFAAPAAGNGPYVICIAVNTSSSMVAYVDGVFTEWTPDRVTFKEPPSDAKFTIGDSLNASGFNATDGIDEVRISRVQRRVGTYTPDASPFVSDEFTLALYHMDTVQTLVGGFVEEITSGTSWTVPSVATHGYDVTSVDVQCYAAGGDGGTNGILNSGGGGGGGAMAGLNNHPVTPGEIIPVQLPFSPGSNNDHTWFRNPSTCLADRGHDGGNTSGLGGAGAGGTGGQAANCVGDYAFSGGDGLAGGVLGTGGHGGGGAGDSGDGEDATGGLGAGPGAGGPTDGGDGGQAGLGGTAAETPGGGGPAGADGVAGGSRILLRYIRRFKTAAAAYAVLSAETAREIDRTNAVSSLALDVSLQRTIGRTGEAAEQLDAALVRKLITRQSAATEGVDVGVQRMASREGSAAAEFDAQTQRTVSRQGEAAEELDCALVRKQIGRTGAAAEGVDAELVRKQIGRTGTATEALDAEVSRRTVGRDGEATEGVDAEVSARTIERYGRATELLDAELRRVFEKYGAAIEDLLGDINARTIHRNAEPAIAALAVEIRRALTRAGVATEELDVTYELARRQADFDTFTQLRAILLQHGHEWLNQHFGPLLLRILQTINIDGESSEDHE